MTTDQAWVRSFYNADCAAGIEAFAPFNPYCNGDYFRGVPNA